MLEIRWKPDRDSKTPIYDQIVTYITGRIMSGEWPAEAVMPTQRELAGILGVNRSTVVTALEELKARGFLETAGKLGTRISRFREETAQKGQPDWAYHIREGVHFSNDETIQQINRLETRPGMIRLSSGEISPELYPQESMKRVLAELSHTLGPMGYEEPRGSMQLREQICIYLKQTGINVSPACILIVSGALQAIQLIAMGLLQAGSMVLMERPSYLYSLNILPSMGMRRYGLPVDNQGLRADLLEGFKPRNHQALLYVNPNFQNPTGTVMSENRRAELMSVCSRERIPVVEDDVYRELWLDNPLPVSLKARDDQGLVLHVSSVSKTLSPGLRIGWIAGPETVIERLSDLKMQADYGSSSLSQAAVAQWMKRGHSQQHMENLRVCLALRREAALSALDMYFSDIARWEVPSGGFYVWLEILVPVRISQVFEEAIKAGVLFYPGYLYDMETNQYMRLSYSYATLEDIRLGIQKLSAIIRRLMKNQG